MKKSEFPEKAYESFLNHELMSMGYMLYIPSQIKENKLGYDVLIQKLKYKKIKSLALQYKIVFQYKNPRSGLSYPCFKMELHKSKSGYTQHNLMVKRNLKHVKTGVAAIYCAPRFVEYDLLYKYSIAKSLVSHSKFIIPQKAITDKQYHYIAFDDKCSKQFSSIPESIKYDTLESIIENQPAIYINELIETVTDSPNDLNCHTLNEFLIQTKSCLLVKVMED